MSKKIVKLDRDFLNGIRIGQEVEIFHSLGVTSYLYVVGIDFEEGKIIVGLLEEEDGE